MVFTLPALVSRSSGMMLRPESHALSKVRFRHGIGKRIERKEQQPADHRNSERPSSSKEIKDEESEHHCKRNNTD